MYVETRADAICPVIPAAGLSLPVAIDRVIDELCTSAPDKPIIENFSRGMSPAYVVGRYDLVAIRNKNFTNGIRVEIVPGIGFDARDLYASAEDLW